MSLRFVLTLAFALQSLGSLLADIAPGAEPPNIVFILADDLGINDLHCYGRADHATPRLDALASQGVRFTSAYCPQPICSASRAALMTGKSPAALHLTTYLPGRADAPSQLLLHPQIEQQLPLAEVTIAEQLRLAGYATACIGKWHLGGEGFSPPEQGFDVYQAGNAKTEPSDQEGGKGEFDLTAHALDFIDAHRDRKFFLYLAHNNPHIPLAAQAERVKKFENSFNPTYAAMIETLDESVGRIVDRIDELGLKERTLIIFTSDNGGLHVPEGDLTPATHNTPFRAGKGYLYEGGLRVPLIVRWPDAFAAGTVKRSPMSNAELTGFLVMLASGWITKEQLSENAKLPAQFRDDDPSATDHPLYWHFPHYTNQGGRPGGAIRVGDWKLIEHYEDGRCELFNLAKDASETTDRSAKYAERVAKLRGRLEAWRREEGAQENSANPEFDDAQWREIYASFDSSSIKPDATFAETAKQYSSWRRNMNQALNSPKKTTTPGAVILHARDAIVHGEKLRYEPEPHKDTLGYWVNPSDWAEWQFTAPAAGTFSVDVLQGCGAGSGAAEVELRVAEQTVRFTVEETGHFQRFVPRTVGTIELTSVGPHTLLVRAVSKPNVAVMDLRRITLRGMSPASAE